MTTTDANPLGVPAHRHTNPDGSLGGWVADTATVSPHASIGPHARVEGGTILGGTILGGTIWGGTIWGGTIEGGTIWGGTIRGGTIEGGTIEGGTIRTSRDMLTLGPIGSEDQHLTLTRTDTGHRVVIGCWDGENTIDQIPAEVQRRCPGHADEYAEIMPILTRRVAEWDAERASAGAA